MRTCLRYILRILYTAILFWVCYQETSYSQTSQATSQEGKTEVQQCQETKNLRS